MNYRCCFPFFYYRVCVWFGMVNMLEELPQRQELTSLFRRSLSRRRSIRSGGGVDRDDRGWTLLHIGARKGDLKEVSFSFFLSFFFILGQEFVLINWLIDCGISILLCPNLSRIVCWVSCLCFQLYFNHLLMHFFDIIEPQRCWTHYIMHIFLCS